MEYENIGFGEFLAARLKEKGLSLKKISEITGITPSHLESMLRDGFETMPSAPYLRGYLLRLGKTLDFNGEEWWTKVKERVPVKNSGKLDLLPANRFIKKAPTGILWGSLVALIVIVYLAFQFPHIFGKPSLAITFPAGNPFTTASNTLMFSGTVKNADALALNGDPILVNPDGTWQKGVLLDGGVNTFQISAKKFLGGETSVMAQVIYEAPATSSTSTGAQPAVHFETSTPATGTFFQ